MKKLTSNLLAILLALFTTASFTSCGSDGDDGPSNEDLKEALQGSWKLSHIKVTAMGQTFEFDEDEIEDVKDYIGADVYLDEYLSFSGNYVNGTLYKIEGNKLNIPAYYGDELWPKVTVTESTMKLELDMSEDGVKIKEVLTYVRTSRSRSGEAVEGMNAERVIATSLPLWK